MSNHRCQPAEPRSADFQLLASLINPRRTRCPSYKEELPRATRSKVAPTLYDGHLVRREHVETRSQPAEPRPADFRPLASLTNPRRTRCPSYKEELPRAARSTVAPTLNDGHLVRREQSDQCLALIGLFGTDWLAAPAVAYGSAVNEVDWESTVVGRAISAWH